jgi:3-hydroxyacyl-CoA dehydrogenase
MSGSVTHSIEDNIAIFEIANPPVNALAHSVRSALLDAVLAADADPAVQGILVRGAGRCFIAGADLREFEAAPRAPLLNDVLLSIEALGKPVLAAMHGAVLGGGLELALACHFRCATEDASFGFPEIKLALMPGSGGTQRLPRLVGAKVALEMMLGGEPVDATRAHTLGIVDRLITDADLAEAAKQWLRELIAQGKTPRRLRQLELRPNAADAALFGVERERLVLSGSGDLAGRYIVECVEAAYHQPFDTALALSRRRFEECRVSPESRALRHLFFAERRPAQAARHTARAVQTVAVIGAGTMGSGIAISLATSGHDVILIDSEAAAVGAGLRRIATSIEASAKKGRMSPGAADAAIARVAGTHEIEAVAPAGLVIEAVFESLAVKQEVFRKLDRLCRADTVLATNTSTLDVDAIGSVTARQSSVVGMHFFSPANVMRLVEIVRGANTAPEAVATALAVTRRMGKLGVIVGNCFGFVGNRMLYAYGRESQLMLLEGASPSQIDAALKSFGMAMGPNAVGDLAGLDIGYRVRRERADRPQDPRYYRVADVLVEAARLGQKTGRGTYRYEAGSRVPIPDPAVEELIIAESRRLGITRRAIDGDEIVTRCVYALINEGAAILREGIAACAADIDAIWCNGYGFPRRRGGPMFYADTIGLRVVVAGVEKFAREQGLQYWTPAPLLVELAQRNTTFAGWDRSQIAQHNHAEASP